MTTAPCSLHLSHSPTNLTVEFHHVIPQAWQHLWVPPGAKVNSTDLWDPRTVPICPTGHRNVHALIVMLMKQIAAQGTEEIVAAVEATGVKRWRSEASTSLLALSRWQEAGGKLLTLTAAKEWGEA